MRQETNINLLNKEKGSSFIDNIIDNDISTESMEKWSELLKVMNRD